jgi:hypothetical protein
MNEESPSAEIIKGPWKRTINTPTEDQIVRAEQLAYCDEISHTCLMAILSILVENGIDASEKSFIKDITFITETIKASIFKTNGIDHPLQVLMDMTTDLQIDPDNSPFCELDEHTIDDMIASYNAVMEPDDDLS